jgi:EAL domain-containing protein (putative c-di-GMP-specific phosphodiesterase class I)/ABC-type nitrate/sulfonate/bicarbonate transport system substrate-binding protein/GGDEF domain-containing protein
VISHKNIILTVILLCSSAAVWAEDVSIHLKWYHKFQFAGYYAAIEQGYFEEEGYTVTLVEGGPNKNHVHQLIDGSSQYAILGSEALNSLALGSPVVIVASIFQHAPEILMSLKSNNVTHISEFKGKTLMMADVTVSGQVHAMLKKHGLIPGSYEKYNYDGNVKKLADGSVFTMYGYISNEPYQLQQLGYDIDIFSPQEYGIDFYGDNLATTKSELENNPKRVAAIRRAVIRGWNYAIEHPEEVIDHILTIKTDNPLPFNRDHQRFEAQETIKLIDVKRFHIGHSSPDRWVAMFDTFNEVNGGQAVFSEASIYNEFHQDKSWIKHLLYSGLVAIAVILALYIWNRTLQSRLTQSIKSLKKVAFEDTLTHMKNRSAMMLHIEDCRLRNKTDLYIAILDISGLQHMNKTMGFQKADNIIRNIANTICECEFKNSQCYSLYSGRFAIIASSEKQEDFTQKINALVALIIQSNDGIRLHSGAIKLNVMLGNSTLTTRAELALQHSKQVNSPHLVYFSQSFSDEAEALEILLEDVQLGINKHQFIAYYQPKIHYQSGEVCGIEALARWDHPSKGMLNPAYFLPAVERVPELMLQLERHLIEHILANANSLIEHFSSSPGFRISINLSSIEFSHGNLVAELLEACRRHSVEPKYIEFELTESSMLENLESAIIISNQLQKAGFHVALDDFGTGYSSLSYIQSLPVNIIKLDYSFVKKIPNDLRSSYVVEHIISLAHKLGLKIVAEGVEEKVQLDYLGKLDVDVIQGFYFHKPMDIDSLCKIPLKENDFH